MGAEAIRALLSQVDLEAVAVEIREDSAKTSSDAKRKKLAKRLEIVDAFRDNRPAPRMDGARSHPGAAAGSPAAGAPGRRPLRHQRLKRSLPAGHQPQQPFKKVARAQRSGHHHPERKRMLQEAVDVLFENGRRGRTITGPNKRPFKSLSDMLKGKHGRFRQNLLQGNAWTTRGAR